MKTHIVPLILGLGCLLSLANADCDLTVNKGLKAIDFPDITKDVADSYIMGVEYSIKGATQTDYYTEYYEVLFKRGRVESHISGKNEVYIYRSESWEAWTLKDRECNLQNITDVGDFYKDLQTDWTHYAVKEKPTTIGPSAMFKTALDTWNKQTKEKKMVYMGPSEKPIRGESAIYWRRCLPSGGYGDYFFAAPGDENAFDTGSNALTPLRVEFNGVVQDEKLANQVYDIISFQHYIPAGVEPFQLPKGRNCQRGPNAKGPKLPDFSDNSLFLSAEVLYKMFDEEGEPTKSYYSTLMFALDKESNYLAYYYSPWNTTQKDPETKEPFENAPEYVIYDITHKYAFKINFETAKCEISRSNSFVPQYKLPENGGFLQLTDPYVLFPNSELKFLTEGTNRGLAVDIFETEIKNYILDKNTNIDRAIVSHSYLRPNFELENTVAVRNASTQMELHFFRDPKKPELEEILTLNIFGFTTRIPRRRVLFDVTRCFKNDDDYLYLTIGFEIENQYLQKIEKALPQIEENVVDFIYTKSELNPVRVPSVMTDFKDNYVYVTLVILDKPTLQMDFNSENGKKVKTSSTDDTQGVSTFDICAKNCLEQKSECWGFSLCGATCYYGSSQATQVEVDNKCTLYRRFNGSVMLSKESQANNVVNQVEAGEFFIMAVFDNDRVTLTATVADITDPAQDDSVFEKMGNRLNPRMRVLKAGKKLKKGSNVKNLGKLRYDECQSLCLDFKNCETLSFCLKNSECILSNKYDSDLTDDETEEDNMCVTLARKYTDHFDRTPGVFLDSDTGIKKDFEKVEDCARACLREGSIKCLSFDHCAGGDKKGCSLYSTHYLNPKDRKSSVKNKNPRCGHYTRKYSTEFKKKVDTRIVGSKVAPITNLTLEECAKACVDYGEGTCFGYDFCQDKRLYATSCTIIDSDPSRLQTTYSSICTNYARTEVEYAPHPYTNSYAGGIGFLCFLVGGIIGAIVVFVIAYIKANRG